MHNNALFGGTHHGNLLKSLVCRVTDFIPRVETNGIKWSGEDFEEKKKKKKRKKRREYEWTGKVEIRTREKCQAVGVA